MSELERPTIRKSDVAIVLAAFIPWIFTKGSTDVEGYTTTISQVTQFMFFRIINTDGSSKYALISSKGDLIYGFFHLMAALFVLHAILLRFYQLGSGNKKLVGTIGSDLFFAFIFSFFAVITSLRDIHFINYTKFDAEWGFDTSRTDVTLIIPIISFVFLAGMLLEYRDTKFLMLNSIYNTIRYMLIILFTVISVFPIIWVAIVSVNKQSVIRSGRPLWPLDPSRPLDFGSYERFFIFKLEGSLQSWGYVWVLFVLSVILFTILYKQVIDAGKWQDWIQGVLYTKVSPKRAGNVYVAAGYWILLAITFELAMLALTLIFAKSRVFGLPNAGFQWYLQMDPDLAGGAVHPIGNWFFVTTIICTGVSLFGIFLSVLSAYALSRFKFPGKTGIVGVVLGTQMFPGIILLLPLLVMWNSLELTNSIFGLTVAYASFAVPFSTFMLKGFFDSLSTDLEEAAMVDGCTRLSAFTRIILPLSLPGLASTFLFSFLTGYTEYLLALTLYRPDTDNYTIALALINVFRVDYQNYYFPDLALYSLIVAAPILLIFVYLQRYLIAGLAAGGTKG
ncbi:MAG: carbohydrate ABC transporter permease [Candidatus Heimdallarchaeota archaeon]|nr:carbohydrate ABC transporter permease [Candidatus Heimdallarchaeota archaeon]